MKKRRLHGIVLLAALTAAGCARAEAAPSPWPTHAPEATPYVRVFTPEAAPPPETDAVTITWDDLYTRFGHFYARKEELDLFRALPPDEPYAFVTHSERSGLDEGETMRVARLFDRQEGVGARVFAMHGITNGLDDWSFLCVVETTPARLFALSEEMDETFMFERFYDEVRERFDIPYWPDGLYAETAEALKDYRVRGCFCFEDETLERLEKLDRDETCAFSLREYTPSGWNEDANSMLSVLRKRGVVNFSMYYKTEEPESLCVASMTLSRLSALSDELPGRYLVRLADEAELAPYDGFIRFSPEGEVLEE